MGRKPLFEINDNDHGGIAIIVTFLLTAWSILSLLVRFYTRQRQSIENGIEDYLCIGATISGCVQAIVVAVSVHFGLGKNEDLITPSQASSVTRTEYSTQLLCLLTITLTKLAAVLSYLRITPRRDQKRACYAVAGSAVICYGVAGILADGIRSTSSAERWNVFGRDCSAYFPIWIFITIIDSLVEIAIFAVPLWIFWELKMPKKTKAAALSKAGFRLLMIPMSILHLIYLHRWLSAPRPFVQVVTPMFWLHIETYYSIMATTLPTIGVFMDTVNTRWGANDQDGIDAAYPPESSYRVKAYSLASGENLQGMLRNHSSRAPIVDDSRPGIQRTISYDVTSDAGSLIHHLSST